METRDISGISFQPLREWMDEVAKRLADIQEAQRIQAQTLLQLIEFADKVTDLLKTAYRR